jgi:hypothetical protein
MTLLTILVTLLTAAIFLSAAWLKFAEDEHVLRTRDGLGIAPGPYRLIGALEVAGATGAVLGLALRPLGIASLTGLVLVALGACAAQVRLRNPASEALPAVLALVLATGALALQIATA